MSSVPVNVYPLATADGLAIPLDVALPKGSVQLDIAASATANIVLPEDTNVCTIYVDQAAELWIIAPTALVDNTYSAGCMLLLGQIAYDLVLPKNISIKALTRPVLGAINVLETWVQMQNTGNYEVS